MPHQTESDRNALTATLDLDSAEYYTDWRLSQLEFNQRVLAQTVDSFNPLLERLKFLCIFSTNMDEFFEVRVASLKEEAAHTTAPRGSEQISPQETLQAIYSRSHELITEQYRILNDVLFPELAQEGIRFISRSDWSDRQTAWVRDQFRKLMPIISPMGLDPAHPFPKILNKSLNFIVSLKGKDAFGRRGGMAIVQAPRILPRILQLPREGTDSGPFDFIFLSSVIHGFVNELFPQMEVLECHQFRVTRNSELYVDEEEIADLRKAIEGELLTRRYGEALRLEVTDQCPEELVTFLQEKFAVQKEEIFRVSGPVNLNRLMQVYDLVDRPDLKYAPFTPSIPKRLKSPHKGRSAVLAAEAPAIDRIHHFPNMFDQIREKDILLYHPFQSFEPVVGFIQQACRDPQVRAIKQTLYRTGDDSAIVNSLVAAAQAGKEVTVVVELRARFDEEVNIHSANRLEEAGAHLVYGVVDYKVHAKMVLVVREEEDGFRNYVHLGTGNYHSKTARLYTDYGYFTCDPDIGDDVHRLFLEITGMGKPLKLNKVLDSPFNLYPALIAKIHRESDNAKAGKPAQIIAKMNQLTETGVIKALYEASMAGVKIDLIVRGTCSLRPGLAGISDNIRVRSIVGRFLEHSRVFYFHHKGHDEVYCSSADWMKRNLFRRVETCFPIEPARLRKRLLQELAYFLEDNANAWELQPDGAYQKVARGDGPAVAAQSLLMEKLAE